MQAAHNREAEYSPLCENGELHVRRAAAYRETGQDMKRCTAALGLLLTI
jgi:hypothetical protein